MANIYLLWWMCIYSGGQTGHNERLSPAASWLPILLSHIGSQVRRRQSQSYKFKEFAKIFKFWNKHYTRHTLWSCLIRCANMKWIQWVLLKIQSPHDSVHRQTAAVSWLPILLSHIGSQVRRRQSQSYKFKEKQQGKSEGFDSCDRPSNLAQIWSKSSIFQPVWPWNFMYDLEK